MLKACSNRSDHSVCEIVLLETPKISVFQIKAKKEVSLRKRLFHVQMLHPCMNLSEVNLTVKCYHLLNKACNNNKSFFYVADNTSKLPVASGVLDDVASVKWMKSEILKAQGGLWATRLEHLYKEKFKKVLPASLMQDLKFKPDIATVDEPIRGRYVLYAPQKQQVLYSDINEV